MLGALAGLAVLILVCERLRMVWATTSLVAFVQTNTYSKKLRHQISRMTLEVFKIQTTVTATVVRAISDQDPVELVKEVKIDNAKEQNNSKSSSIEMIDDNLIVTNLPSTPCSSPDEC